MSTKAAVAVASLFVLGDAAGAPPNPWKCHDYKFEEGTLQNDAWCKTVGTEDGFEYKFSPKTCGNCYCCKREDSEVIEKLEKEMAEEEKIEFEEEEDRKVQKEEEEKGEVLPQNVEDQDVEAEIEEEEKEHETEEEEEGEEEDEQKEEKEEKDEEGKKEKEAEDEKEAEKTDDKKGKKRKDDKDEKKADESKGDKKADDDEDEKKADDDKDDKKADDDKDDKKADDDKDDKKADDDKDDKKADDDKDKKLSSYDLYMKKQQEAMKAGDDESKFLVGHRVSETASPVSFMVTSFAVIGAVMISMVAVLRGRRGRPSAFVRSLEVGVGEEQLIDTERAEGTTTELE